MHIRFSLALTLFIILPAVPVFAAHPLITDDTGTQGRGKYQIELNAEYTSDSGSRETGIGASFSAGIADTVDIVLGVPFTTLRERDEAGDWQTEHGFSDISLELKWRFYEQKGLSLALKPGISLDTGSEERGLGEGTPSYSVFLVATQEFEPLTFHVNAGYIANRSDLRDILHLSVAAEYAVSHSFTLAGNIGGETNPDRESSVHPLFLLGGAIYHVSENFDIDAGIKAGLNKAEPDYAILTGIAYRF